MKIADSYGDTKSKQVASSSRNEDFTSSSILNEPLIIPDDDMQFQANYMGSVSNYSSPLTSPYHTTPTMEIESVSVETNPSSLWVSPDLILDSSKVFLDSFFVFIYSWCILKIIPQLSLFIN